MSDTKYNGWTNYATWRVMLEIFDGLTPRDITGRGLPELSELVFAVEEYAKELIEQSSEQGLARDYANAFLGEVNWWEIADNIITDYADETEDESEEV